MKRKIFTIAALAAMIFASASTRKTHVKITAELKAGKAYIRIVDYIGEYEKASAASIRPQIDQFIAQGVTECDVYLNTGGGSVLEASELVNELMRFGKENVKVYGGSIVASAGTHFTSVFYTILKANTQFMIHRPKLGTYGDIVTIKSDIKLLENKTDEYKQMYVDKTGKTAEEIETMWAAGDVWMTAKEALAQGFVNEVEGMEENITAETVAILEACGAPTIPQPDTNSLHKNKKQMDREKLIALYGLAADATDEQIEAAARKALEKAGQLDNLNANAATAAKTKAELMVNKAHAEKKIIAEEVPHYIVMATNNYDAAEAVLAKKVAIPALSSQLNLPGSGDVQTLEARKNWTVEDYLEKDPKALDALSVDNPTLFAKLNEDYFNSKPKK